jgi:hypothetical protein
MRGTGTLGSGNPNELFAHHSLPFFYVPFPRRHGAFLKLPQVQCSMAWHADLARAVAKPSAPRTSFSSDFWYL